jgi:hypothetical protein
MILGIDVDDMNSFGKFFYAMAQFKEVSSHNFCCLNNAIHCSRFLSNPS